LVITETTKISLSPAVWTYGLAAAAFLAFAVQLAAGWRGATHSRPLVVAVVCSAIWCAASALFGAYGSPLSWLTARAADTLRYAALAFMIGRILLQSPAQQSSPIAPSRRWLHAGWLACVAAFLFELLRPVRWGGGDVPDPLAAYPFVAWLALAIAGLIATEQLYRRTPEALRWHIRPFCLALACIYAYDLVMYAGASLFRVLDANLWAARGLVHAFSIPLLAVAAARNRDWTFDIAVSRGVVLSTVSLFLAGGFLLIVALVGYVLHLLGGTWGSALQPVLVSASLLALIVVLCSGTARSQLRVFIAKHFYTFRYDYRREWLRFTQTLAGSGSEESLQQRCVCALADLVESSGGALWLRDGESGYVQVASLNLPRPPGAVPNDSPFARFLATRAWIVDIPDAGARPDKYPDLSLPPWLADMSGAWLVVPLLAGDDLIGFAVITSPRVRFELDWEVIDLLKTAGRGVASYLAQAQAMEALLEARKFEAFNRMSAFVVHDLKNLAAQLQLVLRNVERHGAKPEFQRDLLATVEHVLGRMTYLMQQLRTGATPVLNAQPIDIGRLVERLKAAHPVGSRIQLEVAGKIEVPGHAERMERVLGHLVQNALDASDRGQAVKVSVCERAGHGIVEIRDDGCGMSAEFVREELFRPFRSTKASGMGLGAYESLHYIRSLGGNLNVHSEPGRGTTVVVELRLHATAGVADVEAVT
jgi:putative PEP-CTERM system histidine kinase